MKYRKTFILSVIAMMMIFAAPSSAFAASNTSLFNYVVNMKIQGSGSLYFDYGKNMSFFLENDWDEYAASCKIKSGKDYKFTKLVNRYLIPVPKSDAYFDGLYNQKGKKVTLQETQMDILRISVDGVYHYDWYPSYHNTKFKNYTKKAYTARLQAYLKGIYGTSRCKVMDTIQAYKIPKKTADYTAKFKKKTAPSIICPSGITKTYGTPTFDVQAFVPSGYDCTYKSSNSSVVKVDKETGSVTIKNPGTASITCFVAEGEKTLPAEYKISITILPKNVTSLTAKKVDKKTLSVKWKGNSKNSGYEIQVSNSQSFSNILAKKYVNSGRKTSSTVKLKSELFHNYVRVRAYKISNGKKIYSGFTTCRITQ